MLKRSLVLLACPTSLLCVCPVSERKHGQQQAVSLYSSEVELDRGLVRGVDRNVAQEEVNTRAWWGE